MYVCFLKAAFQNIIYKERFLGNECFERIRITKISFQGTGDYFDYHSYDHLPSKGKAH